MNERRASAQQRRLAGSVSAGELAQLLAAAAGALLMFVFGLHLAGFLAVSAPASETTASGDLLAPWWSVLVGAVESSLVLALWVWIWKSSRAQGRDGTGASLVLLGWLVLFSIAVFAGGGVLTHMDSPWQAGYGSGGMDNPARVATFWGVYPAYAGLGVGTYLYARTRLARFTHQYGHLFIFVVLGPFMFVPAIDPQAAIHTDSGWPDPRNARHLALYWTVAAAWTVNTGWLLARLLGHLSAELRAREGGQCNGSP